MNQSEYFKDEFRKYFPDLTQFSFRSEAEALYISFHTPAVSPWYWECPRSDDGWYVFRDPELTVITFPFMQATVKSYFEDAFPTVLDEFSEKDLADMVIMPLDSVCGEQCKKAIDRAKALDQLIYTGHGPYYPDHRAETMAIARVALDLCNLYICG